MTDTEREALCARIDELCAENEQLRQENQSVGMAAYELGRASMADENAKLRELFSSYWKRTHSPVGPNVERDYLSEMRELGIEVD